MQRSTWITLGILGGALLLAGGVEFMQPMYVRKFADAIAFAEGYDVPGSLPNTRNNPGDISDSSGVIWYTSYAEGRAALLHQVQLMFTGGTQTHYSPTMTITQIAKRYAGDWSNWATNVGAYLGVDPDTTTLNDLRG
jgi:hypothetical protein